ncbi:MAG: AmmeMemoRadiSam system protein B, partial [Planctomycetes bacterium]|nr:AmmeMemoRadiSam system protein B [Planctomycetota bacterium]
MMGEAPRDRVAAVAGMFYPAKPAEMRRMIDAWLVPGDRPTQAWRAAIVPHAGWVYSGRIAANVLSRIAFPPTVIVLCPKHRHGGAPRAVAPWQRWLFPGGVLESDQLLAKSLAARVPGLELDDTPHRAEHAIEVLLPLLAHL